MANRTVVIALAALLSAASFLPAQSDLESVRGQHGMVASSSEIATRVGVDILRKGGNAVDAATAVGLALAVTHPTAGNIGGGGFMLIRMSDGRCAAIDYRETAPAAATRDMYLNGKGEVVPGASTVGHRAVGVPGSVAGFALAQEKFGSMKWADVVEPARRLASDGFTVSRALAEDLREAKVLAQFAESRRIFLNNGKFLDEGDTWRQPELAETLARLKERGPREFYEGRTAQLIVDEMKAGGGLMTLQDLQSYRPVIREPLRGTYRGYEIISMPPPSSGGVALIEMLNMLERHDVAALSHDTSTKYHLLIEVMRRAFADRAEFMGDPDAVKIPVRGLISKEYAAHLAASIDLQRATPSGDVRHGDPVLYESPQTTHYSIVDAAGNAVANTYTLNTAYGSGVTVRGAGFLLNNEMDDFTSKPGVPNAYGLIQSERNTISPGKRPLSSMAPTILLKDGRLFLVVGTPGGPTIISTVLQVIVNVIDHGMSIGRAVETPRIHHQWLPDRVDWEPSGIVRDVREALDKAGHKLAPKEKFLGDVQGIMVDLSTGTRWGASDPRGGTGAALGY